MARARVFCVPSVTASSGDSEGLGMVFIEAQAMGTPVASFMHGGIPEVVTHERSGLLCHEGDSAVLAASLLRMLVDDQLWTRLSEYGKRDMHARFNITQQTTLLEEGYYKPLTRRL